MFGIPVATIVSALVAILKIVGVVTDRLDADSKKKVTIAAHEALRMKVEDEQIDRARAAYAAAKHSDDVHNPGRVYRD